MHVDEIEQSLRDMAAAQPPVGPGRAAVRRRHRTVRAAQVGAAVVTVVALVVGVAVWRSSDTASSGLHVVTGPTDTLPVDPALARCFPTLTPRSEDKAGAIVDGSTKDLRLAADLLVLTDSGELSVISDGGAVAELGLGLPLGTVGPGRLHLRQPHRGFCRRDRPAHAARGGRRWRCGCRSP